jgi:competence protein ComGC
MEQQEEKGKKNTWFKMVVILLMLVIVILLLLGRCSGRKDEEADSGLERAVKASLGQLDGKSEEEIQAELDRVIEEGMFHISINTNPVFYSGSSEGNLEIENVPNNRYSMLVKITLKDSGEEVYDSGLLDPNYHIQNDSLSKELEAGAYPAVATFYAYDPETEEKIGSTACEITIYVST